MYHNDINNIGEGSYYAKHWKGSKANSADEIAKLVSTCANSPCMWAYGIRKKRNFVKADWLGLDFDEGMSLKDAVIEFEPFLHVIGTTKSHQIDKGGITCDRFRVFLKFATPCSNAKDYEHTVKTWVNETKADKACVDAARYFWPCKEIVSIKPYGDLIGVFKAPELPPKTRQNFANKRKAYETHHKKNGTYPSWIDGKLEGGCGLGMRNKTTYMIAAELSKLGFGKDKIVDMIEQSSIPGCGSDDFTKSEIERTVLSAMRG